MTIDEARAAINAILDALPDDELPEPDKVELEGDATSAVVWFGSHGRHLGSTRIGEKRVMGEYRRMAVQECFDMERVDRMEKAHCNANGITDDSIRRFRSGALA